MVFKLLVEQSDRGNFIKFISVNTKYGSILVYNGKQIKRIYKIIKIMAQHNYTIKELEDIVFNRSRNYKNSEAFQSCLEYVKKTNYPMYKDMLYKEAIACGGIK